RLPNPTLAVGNSHHTTQLTAIHPPIIPQSTTTTTQTRRTTTHHLDKQPAWPASGHAARLPVTCKPHVSDPHASCTTYASAQGVTAKSFDQEISSALVRAATPAMP